jgi:uncharacterized membrane protein
MERRAREQAEASLADRLAGLISAFTGSMWSVGVHAVIFGLWILINVGILPIVPPFDESLVVLAMIASVEAIFLSTFVLMNQNRLAASEDRRSELTLQISLLIEHEVTKLVGVTSALADRLDVALPGNSELDELAEEVVPERVLDEIERRQPKSGTNGS